jgi:two-component system nitrate/nitrite response regulator NarL
MPESENVECIRIGVVDDHPMMRDGIVQALRREPDIEIIADGGSAEEAVEIAERFLPDLILLDINMPGGGLEALKQITSKYPAVGCIVITVREDEYTVTRALRMGARGYILKGTSGFELAQTVRSISQGYVYITPALAARLLAAEAESSDSANDQHTVPLESLSDREIQILRLLAKGLINKQIGIELGLREKTVKHYVTNILQKLQVRNRVEAALIAQRNLITPR